LRKVIWTGREGNKGLTSMTQPLAYYREEKAATQPPAGLQEAAPADDQR
jgi:hypothetical protein